MEDASVHDHERYDTETPPQRLDNGRETGDVTNVSTNGTDTNYKKPPSRGGDDSTSES
jgi:hypothetical protein